MNTIDQWMTPHMRGQPWAERVARIIAASMHAVDPAEAVQRHLKLSGNRLSAGERSYDLDRFRRIRLLGAGKASLPMAQAASEILGDRLESGVVITKKGHASGFAPPPGLEVLEAGHPVPDQAGIQAAQRLIEMLKDCQEDELLVCLISGGASALLVSPVEGLNLEDLQALTSALLACGADIAEINSLRKHIERLKGGGLARLGSPATVLTLILSDVVGDPLDVIASGPTVPDRSTFEQAYGVLQRYDLLSKVPEKIREYLQRGRDGSVEETPKPGDPIFSRVQNIIIGSNRLAAQSGLKKAQELGFNCLLLTTYLQGEARQAGRVLAAMARQIASSGQPLPRPACLIAGGETTVTLLGAGAGGRNQELVLGATLDLNGLEDIALLSLATDGGDGPTDAAGAWADGETFRQARQSGMQVDDFLARNDSYHFFKPLGRLFQPGPTQTNVNDLVFVFAF